MSTVPFERLRLLLPALLTASQMVVGLPVGRCHFWEACPSVYFFQSEPRN